jgi:DinB superfamily
VTRMVGVASQWFLIVRDGMCPSCGLAASSVREEELASAMVAEAGRWVALLDSLSGTPSLRARPSPRVWSALEYAGHTRDTLALFAERVELALAVDDPQFGYQNQDRAVEDGRYNDQDPGIVAGGLLANAEHFAVLLETLPAGGWRRGGIRLEGERFDVALLARFALHEARHHRIDATRSSQTRGGGGSSAGLGAPCSARDARQRRAAANWSW